LRERAKFRGGYDRARAILLLLDMNDPAIILLPMEDVCLEMRACACTFLADLILDSRRIVCFTEPKHKLCMVFIFLSLPLLLSTMHEDN